jgi:hypothetical protein
VVASDLPPGKNGGNSGKQTQKRRKMGNPDELAELDAERQRLEDQLAEDSCGVPPRRPAPRGAQTWPLSTHYGK